MADSKNTFVMYVDWIRMIKELDEAGRSELLLAIMCYQAGEDIPEDMSVGARVAFAQIKGQFDKDAEKYQETIQKRAEAGRNGGIAKAQKAQANIANASKDVANVANASNGVANVASASNSVAKPSKGKQNVAKPGKVWQNVPDNENDNVNENDNENDNDNENGDGNENDLKPKKESVLTDKKEKAAGQKAQSPPKPQSAEEETVDLQEFDDLPDIPPGPKRDYESDFEAFWELYPKQRSKALARKAWYELLPDEDTVKAIMESLPGLIISEDWKKNGGKYIPTPANWLKAEGWEDNPTVNIPDAGNRNDSLAVIDEWGIRYRAEHGGDG